MNKIIIETGGSPYKTCKCINCEKRTAEIMYSMGQHKPSGYMPFCSNCAQDLAYGMLRDVEALIVGEEIAQKHHQDLMERLRK